MNNETPYHLWSRPAGAQRPAELPGEHLMQLNPKTTALVLIDLQKGILAMPVAPYSGSEVYERSTQLAQRFRAAGGLVVWVRVSFGKDHALAPQQLVDQPSNLANLPAGWDEFPHPIEDGDIVVTKRQWGAFHGTDLELQLRRRGIHGIVLAGISTNIGVESTARNAWELGFELVIAEDLCSSSSAEMHGFSIKNIMPRIARVTKAAAIELG
jgi:nicotinamidase-related amidase